MAQAIVVIGGGISGLTAAYFAKQRFPNRSVVVIERDDVLGGMLRTYDYGPYGKFDCGMHFFTETGVPEIDDLVFSLLPSAEWDVLEGERRDLSGLFFRGRLQSNTQYPDLRGLPRVEYERCIAGFFETISRDSYQEPQSLDQFARDRFGSAIAEIATIPVAEKVHGRPATDIHPMARKVPLLERVALFDERIFRDLAKSPILRDRIAFPEQRHLPLEWSSGRRSLYPRNFGTGRVIGALLDRLKSVGVDVHVGTEVSGVQISDGNIVSVMMRGQEGDTTIDDVSDVLWSGALPPLARLLNVSSAPPPDRLRSTIIVNLLLDRPPEMGGLYCLFCGDAPYATYRVTDYSAFCTGARREGGYPLCVELIVGDPQGHQGEFEAQAARELEAFGVLEPGCQVLFAKSEVCRPGFPTVSLGNVAAIERLRDSLLDLGLANLQIGGILSKPDLLFQDDVLRDFYAKVQQLA